MDVDRLIGWNLRRIRRNAGLSQLRAGAQIVHADQSSLSKIENGQKTISVITLYKIARGLDVDAGEFYSINDVPKSILGNLDEVIVPVRPPRKKSGNKTSQKP